jgi:hypothetical protein
MHCSLYTRASSLHGNAKTYQTYIWVTKHGRAWLTRGIWKQHQQSIATDAFSDESRDLTNQLNRWDVIKAV